ncbi:MAG: ABC transporter ATP-binding protein [Bacteroidetes bacterium]|nr:ABC transporter ATP-binding protein [Bacteroidota bacterium]
MKSFNRILKLLWPHKTFIGLNFIFNLIQIIAGLFTIGLVMPFLEILFKNGESLKANVSNGSSFNILYADFIQWLNQIVQSDKTYALALVSITLIVATVIKNFSRYMALYFLVILRLKSIKTIREKIYAKLLRLPISYFSNERKGDIISRMSNDMKEVEWSMNSSLEALYKEPIMIIAYSSVLFFISAKLTLFVIILFPIAAGIIAILGKSIRRKSKRNNEAQSSLMTFLEESLGGMRIIKAFGVENFFNKNYQTLNDKSTELNMKVNQRGDLASPISETLTIIVAGAILWFGGNMVINGEIEASAYIGYFGLFSQLNAPIKVLSQAFPMLERGASSLDRFDEILNADEKINEISNPLPIHEIKESIQLKNVCFSYGSKQVLTNINITIPKGKKIALVGSSGSGKSTIGDLVPRFYDIQSGALLIDGISISDYNIKNLRALMGIVSQEAILFNDTIANNIIFGLENVKQEDFINAAKQANAYEFIMQSENGFETVIGERGGKLSGGQRQRIAIARALLRNPQILILDEATSALDNESEKLVQQALDNLRQGRTTLVIAHRLTTIQDSDEIIVLDKGEIIEQGNHQTLMENKGAYYKLYNMHHDGNA